MIDLSILLLSSRFLPLWSRPCYCYAQMSQQIVIQIQVKRSAESLLAPKARPLHSAVCKCLYSTKPLPPPTIQRVRGQAFLPYSKYVDRRAMVVSDFFIFVIFVAALISLATYLIVRIIIDAHTCNKELRRSSEDIEMTTFIPGKAHV